MKTNSRRILISKKFNNLKNVNGCGRKFRKKNRYSNKTTVVSQKQFSISSNFQKQLFVTRLSRLLTTLNTRIARSGSKNKFVLQLIKLIRSRNFTRKSSSLRYRLQLGKRLGKTRFKFLLILKRANPQLSFFKVVNIITKRKSSWFGKRHRNKNFSRIRQVRKNPFQNLEKFSFFRLIGYIRKRRYFKKRGGGYKFKKKQQRKSSFKRYTVSSASSKLYPPQKHRKKLKNLVFKNKVWCLKIKKSDGRLIYRPLKLSDFLSSKSGWRTRTSSFKKSISKSGKSIMLIRGTVRARNEHDIFLFRKRKIYNYYKRIYKFIKWRFSHYRSIFKKYSLSRYKYISFSYMPFQFAWESLSNRVVQLKAANLKDGFKNIVRYLLFANSTRVWKINQFMFINGILPVSFYSQIKPDRHIGITLQNRPIFYNWNKKYRKVYGQNTRVWHSFPSPVRVSPAIYYKNSSLFTRYSPRFSGLITNYQRHFIR